MKTAFIIVMLLASFPACATARLGETEDQLIKRFGKELANNMLPAKPEMLPGREEHVALRYLTFDKPGWAVFIYLYNGLSAKEEISKSQDQMTILEAQHLLDDYAQGHLWKKVETPRGRLEAWLRDDGATAQFTGNGFVFKSKELLDAELVARKNAQSPDMRGF